jgi:hypothetical protein
MFIALGPLSENAHKEHQGDKSASRPLVDFGALNDNLIKGLISCINWISMFLIKVQMYSLIHLLEYNYEANWTLW